MWHMQHFGKCGQYIADRKLRTNQICVTNCLLLTCDNVFVVFYSCSNCDKFGFSVINLLTLILVTLSAKLVTMLHRTNIRLLNWAVNLFTLFLWSSNENLPFYLWHLVGHCDTWTMWHHDTVTQTMSHKNVGWLCAILQNQTNENYYTETVVFNFTDAHLKSTRERWSVGVWNHT